MLKTLKFSGSADIDFLSVIHAKNVNNARHAGLVMLKSFHIALRLGFLSAKGCLSLLIGRNDILEGRYLQTSNSLLLKEALTALKFFLLNHDLLAF